MKKYDCIVIGGGPAGLAATLTLGRARRNVAIFDNATNRNRVTQESHGFLTRDGVKSHEFKSIGMRELQAYPSITIFNETVIEIKKDIYRRRLKIKDLLKSNGYAIRATAHAA